MVSIVIYELCTCRPQSLRCPLLHDSDCNIIVTMFRIIVNLMIYHELAYAFQLTFCLVSDTDFSKALTFCTRFAICDYLRSNGSTKTLLNSFCLHGFPYLCYPMSPMTCKQMKQTTSNAFMQEPHQHQSRPSFQKKAPPPTSLSSFSLALSVKLR